MLGSSETLPNASLLSGKDIMYIEPITKIGNDFVKPFFRKKEKAPEGADKSWIVSNDPDVDFVEGMLVRTGIEMRDPHPSSGLTGQIPYINLFIQDTVNQSLIYILESKMTSLGRDIVNTVLNFDEFDKVLRIRLYSYKGGDRLRAGVTFETDIDLDEPKIVQWKFEKSKYLKADAIKVGNRTEYDWSKVDDMLLHAFYDYGTFLDSKKVKEPENPPVAQASKEDAVVPTEVKQSTKVPPQVAFSPSIPKTRKGLIDYGVRVGVFETPQEVEAYVDSLYGEAEGDGTEELRKKVFWRILNTNLPKELHGNEEDPDPCRVIAFFARSPLYNMEVPNKAVHMVAKNFKKFREEHCKRSRLVDCVRSFISNQNELISTL